MADDNTVDVPLAVKTSDLPKRLASAVVMLGVAGAALWFGGWLWTVFVAALALGVLWEWWGLVRRFVPSTAGRAAWLLAGLIYVGSAAALFNVMRSDTDTGLKILLVILLGVIGTDVGAYFAGRTFGGPKIAPSISPSKTWSGLLGGIVGASAMILLVYWAWDAGLCEALNPRFFDPSGRTFQFDGPCSFASLAPMSYLIPQIAITGTVFAVVAQTGDFFESWMKRRAGVKDSGSLLPGHGGLFDRADGLIAVTFAFGVLYVVGILVSLRQ